MFQRSIFILFFILVLLTSSCSNDDFNFNEEYKNQRMNYVGHWQVELNRKDFIRDSLVIENDLSFEITLHEDGSGSQESLLFITDDSINWYYEPYPEQFTILKSRVANDPTFSGPYNRDVYQVVERNSDLIRMTSEVTKIDIISNDTSRIVRERIHIRIN